MKAGGQRRLRAASWTWLAAGSLGRCLATPFRGATGGAVSLLVEAIVWWNELILPSRTTTRHCPW